MPLVEAVGALVVGRDAPAAIDPVDRNSGWPEERRPSVAPVDMLRIDLHSPDHAAHAHRVGIAAADHVGAQRRAPGSAGRCSPGLANDSRPLGRRSASVRLRRPSGSIPGMIRQLTVACASLRQRIVGMAALQHRSRRSGSGSCRSPAHWPRSRRPPRRLSVGQPGAHCVAERRLSSSLLPAR